MTPAESTNKGIITKTNPNFIDPKELTNTLTMAGEFKNPIDVPFNSIDLGYILRKRFERICHEMDDWVLILCSFTLVLDFHLNKFLGDITELQINLNNI